ncbi:T-lymphocyte surface antigen Ly-9 isoform X4 [Neofelis nebulosa]|uniref:T-lymphocyte surface antigen Ly-9 isoform X4 n=1 Tax=Neofelis nebulosa TaxID=61452 RepID=UPI00272D118D|nr:T-lymphocyte surface antigen Ly-9 isoform X4 [Neofelis nebulosa]
MAGPKKHPDDWVLRSFSRKPQKSQPHVFSPLLWTHLLFLLVGLEASGKDSPPTVVPGILGGSVTFSLNISVDTEIEHVTWNGPQNALALAVTETQVIIMDKSYQNRLNISWNYSLSISNLTLKDAGSYKAQINRKNSKVTADEEFILRVYEQVQVPRVVVKSVNVSDSASCNITLICSVERAGTSVLYSWTPKNTHASESHGASTITIYWMPCDPDLPYTCTARNPVSQSTSGPIHARQFCTAPGASRGGSTGETVVGILGESVTLPLTLSASRYVNNIVWMFNTSIITKKQEVKPKIPDKNSGQDYSLKIGQLKMENAGHYYAYVCSEASRVISRRHFTLLIYRQERNMKLYIGLSLVSLILLCFGISIWWCMWKQKGRRGFLRSMASALDHILGPLQAYSVPDSSSNQAETPADAPGYEKLDTLLKTAKQRSRPPSASSSDSSGTTEETTDMVKAGRCQEDTGPDSASERPAEYDLVMLRNAPAPTAQDNTVYAQVFLNLQVSPFDQYTFPPPPVLTPSNILDDLVPPHGEPGPAAHEQTSVALLMLTKPWAPLE